MIKYVNNIGNKRIGKCLLVTILFAAIFALGGAAFFISQSTAIQEQISQKQEQPLSGIKHYELEFHVGVKGRPRYDFETVTQKYEKPILTTMSELNRDFPMGEANRSPVVVEEKSLELEDEELVWAYVSRYDNYICDDMVFVYDKLEVSNESADIETHFEITEHIPSTAANFDILVLTIIPANQ